MQDQLVEAAQSEITRQLPRWQIGVLLLMLFAFLGTSYAFLQPERRTSPLPPVLYLAEDDAGLLQLYLTHAPD